jgi:hypothetical protein
MVVGQTEIFNHMKNLIKSAKKLVVGVLVSVASVCAFAQNQTNVITTGISWIAAGATSNALSTAYVEVKNHQEIALQWRLTCSNTNIDAAGNVLTALVGGSQVPSNFVALGSVRAAIGNTATNPANVGTNFYLGSYRYFGVISMSNGGTNTTATNSSPSGVLGQLWIQAKDNRNGLK